MCRDFCCTPVNTMPWRAASSHVNHSQSLLRLQKNSMVTFCAACDLTSALISAALMLLVRCLPLPAQPAGGGPYDRVFTQAKPFRPVTIDGFVNHTYLLPRR